MEKVCEFCKTLFSKPYNISKKSWLTTRFCSILCRNRALSMCGSSNPRWKGGSINKSGYKMIYHNRKQVREHRLIMEKHIGRELMSYESIHHINGNKLDNRLENLQLLTKKEHSKLHYPNLSLFGVNSNKKLMTKEEKLIKNREYHRKYVKLNIDKIREYSRNYQKRKRIKLNSKV